jgi:hypothetical protein
MVPTLMKEPINLLFPNSWHSDTLQYRLVRAGIVAPINTTGLQDLYPGLPEGRVAHVPFFGDDSLKHFWEKTGGNPIALIQRSKLCIVVSPIVHGVRYNDIFFGKPDETDVECERVVRKPLPPYFEENFELARKTTIATLNDLTSQTYEVLATKLNPLSNGKCNVVIFIKFQHECPFDRQFYTPVPWPAPNDPKVRIIPHPLVSQFGEPQPGLKLTFNFVFTDKDVFKVMYSLFQNFVEHTLGMHFRYMKVDDYNKAVYVYAQHTLESKNDDIGRITNLEKMVKNINFAPYVLLSMQHAVTTV